MTGTHPEKRLIGYARVSTYGQTLDSRLEQLRQAGCASRNIYREKVTGARSDRREFNRMLGKLGPGDVVTVTHIDRLARSTLDLFAIVKRIVDDFLRALPVRLVGSGWKPAIRLDTSGWRGRADSGRSIQVSSEPSLLPPNTFLVSSGNAG